MDRNLQPNGSPRFDGAATNPSQVDQRTSPTRSTVLALYPTTQQSGYDMTSAGTQSNERVINSDLPQNHMMLAVLSTLFCACPCGLASLLYAMKVNSTHAQGNLEAALYNSKQAWKYGMISVAIGCAIITVVMCYYLILVSQQAYAR
ncbi:transmembrane protein 91-like [Acropora muricata]|uniref:transmembrane protein 91-like n=1 Tax=Acropora muricata TaxID=159855 RepID=UPI0034E50820